jgi:hypothetical protein
MKKIKFRNLLCWSPFCSWAALWLLGPRERETSCWVRERERVRVRLRSQQRRERESKGRETNRREWSMALPFAGSERERSAGRSVGAGLLGERDSELGERDRELGERDSELGERDRELGERDRELGGRWSAGRERQRAGRAPAEGRFGSEGAGRWVRERRSAGRWAVVEWSVGTGPSFGEKELGAGRGTVRVRGGRSLGGGDGGRRG